MSLVEDAFLLHIAPLNTPPQTTNPASRRWRWPGAVLLVLLAAIAVVGWREYTWQRAVRELREAGIVKVGPDSSLRTRLRQAAGEFWPDLFRARTWMGEENREVAWSLSDATARRLRNLDAVAPALRRVNPDLLFLQGCTGLQSVDGLKGLSSLKVLNLTDCTALQNVDGLKGFASLQELKLTGCTALQNVDGLKSLTSLLSLSLRGCTALQNVDGLESLTLLEQLDLSGCTELQNVDGIMKLTSLKISRFDGCTKITPEQLAAFRAALLGTGMQPP